MQLIPQSMISGLVYVLSAITASLVTLGTAAFLNVGTAVGDVVQLGAGGRLPSSTFPAGALLDMQYAVYTTNADLTTVIPLDDTIPQSTEGTQILSVTITPKATTSKIKLTLFVNGSTATAAAKLIAAIFRDATANAIFAAAAINQNNADMGAALNVVYVDAPATTSAVTYKVRVGANTGTARVNGTTAGRLFGGVSACHLIAEEIAG